MRAHAPEKKRREEARAIGTLNYFRIRAQTESKRNRDAYDPAMAKVDRRSMLVGAFGGVVAGGGVGFLSGTLSQKGATSSTIAPFEADGAKTSYAQQGEDLAVASL